MDTFDNEAQEPSTLVSKGQINQRHEIKDPAAIAELTKQAAQASKNRSR